MSTIINFIKSGACMYCVHASCMYCVPASCMYCVRASCMYCVRAYMYVLCACVHVCIVCAYACMYCARMYVFYACVMYVLCALVHACIVCARACMFLTQIFYTCESSRIKTNVALVNPITSVFCNATNISTMNATSKTPHQQCMPPLLSVFSPHATFIRVLVCFLFICR